MSYTPLTLIVNLNKNVMNNLAYLLYCIPLIFILLSRKYNLQFRKLKNTGKIPRIVGARKKQILFFWLAILSALIIVI